MIVTTLPLPLCQTIYYIDQQHHISKHLHHKGHKSHANITFVKYTEGGEGGGGDETHADGPRRNSLTALLCSSVCWGHRWDLVGHKVALYIPDTFTSRITLPAYTQPQGREGGGTDGLLQTQSVTNQLGKSSNAVLDVMKCYCRRWSLTGSSMV